jgi:hypothetical protein
VPGQVHEIKRHYNKPTQVFACERLFQDNSRLILRYVSCREFPLAGQIIPLGSVTIGLYQIGERHVLWRLTGPDGHRIGCLAHLCDSIELVPDGVSYQDLMLDVWQGDGAAPILLDEDELSDAVERGWISADLANQVREIAAALIQRWPEIIADFEAVIRRCAPGS